MKYILLSFAILLFASCNKAPGDIKPPNLVNNGVQPDSMVMTMTNNTLVADTTKYQEVILKVGTAIAERYKSAFFSIGPVGLFNNGLDTITAPIDITGQAHVFVHSNDEGAGNIIARVANLSRSGTITFTPRSIDTLTLYMAVDQVPADNYTYAEIRAVTTDPDVIKKMKNVKFTTPKGTFSDGSMEYSTTVGIDGIASAFLKYNKAEAVTVTATISGTYRRQQIVRFTPAWPDLILIESDESTLTPELTSKTKVSAKLIRTAGTVSEGITISFRDSSVSSDPVGLFINSTPSDANGSASATFGITDTAFHGSVYIIGEFQVPGGNKVRGMNRIIIQ